MKYEDLPLLPFIIAETICQEEYKGQEYSPDICPPAHIDKIEALRKKMSREDVEAFCKFADKKCRAAFDAKARWFIDCVKNNGSGRNHSAGRDQLYIWIRHWLPSYLVKQ